MNSSLLLAAALLVPATAGAFSDADISVNSAQFLRLGAGARSLGMAEAMAAVPDGLFSLHWNPAGLGLLGDPQMSAAHSQFFSDFSHDFAAYGRRVESLDGTLAGSMTLLQQSGILAVNNAGQEQDFFHPYSAALSLGYGRRLDLENRSLLWGVALKGIEERLYDTTAHAFAADFGVQLQRDFEKGRAPIDLGLAVRNLGSKETFYKESQSLPLEIAVGASRLFKWDAGGHLLAATEVSLPAYGRISGKIGVEYAEQVTRTAGMRLRLGYKSLTASDLNALSGITAGVGLAFPRLAVDFGFQPMGVLAETYRFSVSYAFGPGPRRQAQTAVQAPAAIPVAAAPAATPVSRPAARPVQKAAPISADQYFLRAEEAISAGHYMVARNELRIASVMLNETDQRMVTYFERRGHVYLLEDDAPLAKDSFMEAIGMAGRLGLSTPSLADAYAGMGVCLLREGDVPSAIDHFNKGLEVNPSKSTRRLIDHELQRLASHQPAVKR